MDEHACLAEQFEADRPHLRAIAYRMLGSLSEADDAFRNPGSAPAQVGFDRFGLITYGPGDGR